jgi:hypothetical protein
MMNLKNPFKKLPAPTRSPDESLLKMRERRVRLTEQRTASVVELEAALAGRRAILLDDDPTNEHPALATVQTKIVEIESTIRGLDDALSSLDSSISETERRIDEENERAERIAASGTINGHALAAEKLLLPWFRDTVALATAFERLSPVSWEGGSISRYLLGALGEVELAAAASIASVRNSAHLIMTNQMALPSKAAAPDSKPAAPLIPTIPVFTMRGLRWRDAHDPAFEQHRPQFADVDLSPELAAKALALGAAIPFNDQRVRELKRSRSPKFVRLDDCISLDDNATSDVSLPSEQADI